MFFKKTPFGRSVSTFSTVCEFRHFTQRFVKAVRALRPRGTWEQALLRGTAVQRQTRHLADTSAGLHLKTSFACGDLSSCIKGGTSTYVQLN